MNTNKILNKTNIKIRFIDSCQPPHDSSFSIPYGLTKEEEVLLMGSDKVMATAAPLRLAAQLKLKKKKNEQHTNIKRNLTD